MAKTISLKDAEQARLEITAQQAADVEKLYRAVYRDLRKQLKSMTAGGATQSLRKTQLKQLTESLKEAYTALGAQLEGNITSSVTQASQAVVDANTAWMDGIGLKLKEAYAYVPQDIVTLLASGKLYSDGWTLSKAIWGESQQKAHEIDVIVAKGVAANKSSYEIAKDLESYVNPGALKPWDWSKVYPGTSKKVDYNAQRLARTMVSHAYQQSLERVCSKNPFVVGYKWRSAHTARTCEICNARSEEDHHGLGPGVYPKGELPLDHPNGMCTFLTVMSGDLESISNRLADWASGGEDPELDKWYNDMGGKAPQAKVTPEEKQKATGISYKELSSEQAQEYTDKLLTQMYGDVNSIPADQLKALSDYTGDSYTAMNSNLRGKYKAGGTRLTKAQVKKETESLQNLISSSTLPEGVITYRGLPEKCLKGLKPGDVFSDKAFTSSSVDQDIALGFVGSTPGGAMLKIEAGAGSRAIPATAIKKAYKGYNWLDEAELLFGGGQEFSVVSSKVVTLDHDVKNGFDQVMMRKGTSYTEVTVRVV